jgi:hypothetical protein
MAAASDIVEWRTALNEAAQRGIVPAWAEVERQSMRHESIEFEIASMAALCECVPISAPQPSYVPALLSASRFALATLFRRSGEASEPSRSILAGCMRFLSSATDVDGLLGSATVDELLQLCCGAPVADAVIDLVDSAMLELSKRPHSLDLSVASEGCHLLAASILALPAVWEPSVGDESPRRAKVCLDLCVHLIELGTSEELVQASLSCLVAGLERGSPYWRSQLTSAGPASAVVRACRLLLSGSHGEGVSAALTLLVSALEHDSSAAAPPADLWQVLRDAALAFPRHRLPRVVIRLALGARDALDPVRLGGEMDAGAVAEAMMEACCAVENGLPRLILACLDVSAREDCASTGMLFVRVLAHLCAPSRTPSVEAERDRIASHASARWVEAGRDSLRTDVSDAAVGMWAAVVATLSSIAVSAAPGETRRLHSPLKMAFGIRQSPAVPPSGLAEEASRTLPCAKQLLDAVTHAAAAAPTALPRRVVHHQLPVASPMTVPPTNSSPSLRSALSDLKKSVEIAEQVVGSEGPTPPRSSRYALVAEAAPASARESPDSHRGGPPSRPRSFEGLPPPGEGDIPSPISSIGNLDSDSESLTQAGTVRLGGEQSVKDVTDHLPEADDDVTEYKPEASDVEVLKQPSEDDDVEVLKQPSEDDDAEVLKQPSEDDDAEVLKQPSEDDDAEVLKQPSEDDDAEVSDHPSAEMSQSLDDLRTKEATLKALLHDVGARVKDLELQLEAAERTAADLEARCAASEERERESQARLIGARSRGEEAERQLQRAREHFETLEAETERLEDVHRDAVMRAQEARRQTEQAEQAASEARAAQVAAEQATSEARAAQAAAEEAASKAAEAQADAANTASESLGRLEELTAQVSERQARIKALEQTVVELETEDGNVTVTLQEARARRQQRQLEVDAELAELREQSHALELTLEKHKEQLTLSQEGCARAHAAACNAARAHQRAASFAIAARADPSALEGYLPGGMDLSEQHLAIECAAVALAGTLAGHALQRTKARKRSQGSVDVEQEVGASATAWSSRWLELACVEGEWQLRVWKDPKMASSGPKTVVPLSALIAVGLRPGASPELVVTYEMAPTEEAARAGATVMRRSLVFQAPPAVADPAALLGAWAAALAARVPTTASTLGGTEAGGEDRSSATDATIAKTRAAAEAAIGQANEFASKAVREAEEARLELASLVTASAAADARIQALEQQVDEWRTRALRETSPAKAASRPQLSRADTTSVKRKPAFQRAAPKPVVVRRTKHAAATTPAATAERTAPSMEASAELVAKLEVAEKECKRQEQRADRAENELRKLRGSFKVSSDRVAHFAQVYERERERSARAEKRCEVLKARLEKQRSASSDDVSTQTAAPSDWGDRVTVVEPPPVAIELPMASSPQEKTAAPTPHGWDTLEQDLIGGLSPEQAESALEALSATTSRVVELERLLAHAQTASKEHGTALSASSDNAQRVAKLSRAVTSAGRAWDSSCDEIKRLLATAQSAFLDAEAGAAVAAEAAHACGLVVSTTVAALEESGLAISLNEELRDQLATAAQALEGVMSKQAPAHGSAGVFARTLKAIEVLLNDASTASERARSAGEELLRLSHPAEPESPPLSLDEIHTYSPATVLNDAKPLTVAKWGSELLHTVVPPLHAELQRASRTSKLSLAKLKGIALRAGLLLPKAGAPPNPLLPVPPPPGFRPVLAQEWEGRVAALHRGSRTDLSPTDMLAILHPLAEQAYSEAVRRARARLGWDGRTNSVPIRSLAAPTATMADVALACGGPDWALFMFHMWPLLLSLVEGAQASSVERQLFDLGAASALANARDLLQTDIRKAVG